MFLQNDAYPPLRTFNLGAGDHPVKWLIDTLAFGEGILDAMRVWFDDVAPGVIPGPVMVSKNASSL